MIDFVDGTVSIVFLNPDARSRASQSFPLEERLVSLVLHRIYLSPVSGRDFGSMKPPRAGPSKTLQGEVMGRIYGHDVWRGYVPTDIAEAEVQGWNGRHPVLRRLTAQISNKVVLDVGVWKGQSTVFMAEGMKLLGIDGCVIAVDTFLWPELWTEEGKLFERHPGGRSNVYDLFLENVFKAGLTNLVVPLSLATVAAAKLLGRCGIKVGLVHYDASREYAEVKQDAAACWALLEAGGFFVGDDYGASWPGVTRAAHEFAAEVEEPLAVEGPKWILQKRFSDTK